MEEKTFTEYQIVCAASELQKDLSKMPAELSDSFGLKMFNAGVNALAEALVEDCDDLEKKKVDAIFKVCLEDMFALAKKGQEAEDKGLL